MCLLGLPDKLSLVLIELVAQLVARFDHKLVQVMSELTIEWHRNSLQREGNAFEGMKQFNTMRENLGTDGRYPNFHIRIR
jgi:hypothetical protein